MTPRQLDILRFFNDFQRTSAIAPTMQQVADALSIVKITVFEHLKTLLRDGLMVQNGKFRSRSYQLTAKGIAALGPAPDEWFDVTVRMPDADTTVLVHVPKADEPVWLGYFDGERWCYADGMNVNHPVAHWREIPAAPIQSDRTLSRKSRPSGDAAVTHSAALAAKVAGAE